MPHGRTWSEMSGQGSVFWGRKILSTAAQLYKNPSSFANAFDTELEAQEVFNQLAESTGLDAQHLSGEAATRLVEWSVSRQFVFKRQRRAVAVELECSLFAKRVDAPVEASDAYETMVKDDPKACFRSCENVFPNNVRLLARTGQSWRSH